MRRRVIAAFDRFIDARALSDTEIAKVLRERETDIAVDLNGHTHGSRMEIFAHRPARIQVGYLGFPGTSGANFFDYIIGDEVLLPQALQPFYSEKIMRLPGTFWVSDSTRSRAPIPTRAAVGLPEEGFVFCAFNNHWKITQRFFAVWMRLLAAVPGSVLWLKHARDDIVARLKNEAASRGIAPDRLIFAPPLDPVEDHIARHAAADLFLDTLPYNAHASASDALWAGLPVVTCLGSGFPGRVGASLLQAIGLPELITEDLENYEALALALARDPSRLAGLRERLERNRVSSRLFDTAAHCREIEAAYRQMLT
jgi:predicted O-linked N-acetylglucosamine transferase (SPINDLY family)